MKGYVCPACGPVEHPIVVRQCVCGTRYPEQPEHGVNGLRCPDCCRFGYPYLACPECWEEVGDGIYCDKCKTVVSWGMTIPTEPLVPVCDVCNRTLGRADSGRIVLSRDAIVTEWGTYCVPCFLQHMVVKLAEGCELKRVYAAGDRWEEWK